MPYRSGDLKVVTGELDAEGYPLQVEPNFDARADEEKEESYRVSPGAVFLPHSCQEWVIGGLEQVEAMLADLTRIRDELRGRESSS